MVDAGQAKLLYKKADVAQPVRGYSCIGHNLGGTLPNQILLAANLLAAEGRPVSDARSLESYGKEPFGENIPNPFGGGWVQLPKESEIEAMFDLPFSSAPAASTAVAPSLAETIQYKIPSRAKPKSTHQNIKASSLTGKEVHEMWKAAQGADLSLPQSSANYGGNVPQKTKDLLNTARGVALPAAGAGLFFGRRPLKRFAQRRLQKIKDKFRNRPGSPPTSGATPSSDPSYYSSDFTPSSSQQFSMANMPRTDDRSDVAPSTSPAGITPAMASNAWRRARSTAGNVAGAIGSAASSASKYVLPAAAAAAGAAATRLSPAGAAAMFTGSPGRSRNMQERTLPSSLRRGPGMS